MIKVGDKVHFKSEYREGIRQAMGIRLKSSEVIVTSISDDGRSFTFDFKANIGKAYPIMATFYHPLSALKEYKEITWLSGLTKNRQ